MKIGIIGCGMIAKTHARVLLKLIQDGQLFLCDINRKNAEKLASKCVIQRIYTNVEELFSEENLDAVHILTPIHTHVTIAEKALYNGCHIYIEKPVTETVDEFKKLCDLAKNQGKIMCVGYSAIGMPAVIEARKEIASGKFGRLIAVHCDFMCSGPANVIPYGDPNHWSYSAKGGILQNMADHPASLVVDAMDGVQEHNMFFSRRNVLPNDCPDLMHVVLRNEDQIGSFTLSLGHGSAHRQIIYFLEEGTIIVDMTRQLVTFIRGRGPQNFIKKTLSGINMGWNFSAGSIGNILKVIKGSLQRDPGIVNLVHNFYNAIWGKKELIVDHHMVEQVVCLLEDIWRAMNYNSNIVHSNR